MTTITIFKQGLNSESWKIIADIRLQFIFGGLLLSFSVFTPGKNKKRKLWILANLQWAPTLHLP